MIVSVEEAEDKRAGFLIGNFHVGIVAGHGRPRRRQEPHERI